METLLRRWQSKHLQQGYSHFIFDGIVNEDIWAKENLKICFFLKEAYLAPDEKNDYFEWSLVEWLNKGAVKKMWHTVAEWTYGLHGTTHNFIPHYSNAQALSRDEKVDMLRRIAVVNAKKSDGISVSTWEDLVTFAVADRELLKQQIEFINPNIIICGNNASLLRVVYGANVDDEGRIADNGLIDHAGMTQKGYYWLGDTLIIDFYHPANQFPKMMNYYSVCCLYQQAQKERNS